MSRGDYAAVIVLPAGVLLYAVWAGMPLWLAATTGGALAAVLLLAAADDN